MPVPPEVTVIQLGPVTVEYEHPATVFTATAPEPPLAGHEASKALKLTAQLAPVSVAVKTCPATLAVNTTVDAVGFGGIVNVTVPLPVTDVAFAPNPDAVQEHDWSEVETATGTVPPAAETGRLDGLMANAQPPVPNWVMWNRVPFTAIVPVRVLPGFAAIL
jgi:hypothetical protein